MSILLWVLQVLAALLYGASGVMKVFMFDKVSRDVPSFGALPREAWTALGIIELVCMVGLIVPAAFRWHPSLTVVAAAILALESLVFYDHDPATENRGRAARRRAPCKVWLPERIIPIASTRSGGKTTWSRPRWRPQPCMAMCSLIP